MGNYISDSEDRLLGERVLVERFEIEVNFFLTILENVIDSIDIGRVFELIIQKREFLSFDILEVLRCLVRPFDIVGGENRISPEHIDVKRILNVLFFDLFVKLVAVDDFLVD